MTEEILRSDRARPWLLALCAVLGAAAPLCMILGVRGMAPVVGIGGLLCIPAARITRKDAPGVGILAALVLWAALSIAWSPAPNLRVLDSAKALGRFTILHLALQLAFCSAFVTALGRLDGARAGKALRWMALGVLLALPILTEEGFSHGKLHEAILAWAHQRVRPDWTVAELAQGGYLAAVLAWPLGVAPHGRRRLHLGLAVMVFVPLSMVLLRGVAPTVALAVSLPVFFLTLRFGQTATRGLAAITAAYMLLTPLAMLGVNHLGLYPRFKSELPPSWADRLRIWSFIAERFREAPLRGAGLDASRTFPGVVPLHPHNAPLQLWYELGIPGAVLGTLFWLWLWRRIGDCARQDRLYGATAAASATVYLMISALSFGLWQEWWLCVGAFAMALCVLLGKTLVDPPQTPQE